MAHHPDFDTVDWSGLVISVGGGMAVQQRHRQALAREDRLPDRRGLRPVARPRPRRPATRSTAPPTAATSACRCPTPNSTLLDDDGNEVPMGTPGEIAIRGPQVMAGYWQRPDETAKVMTRRRVLPHRRHRHRRRARLLQDRRPQEGHDPRQRLQRLPERGRGRGHADARRARMRGGRRARREGRRGGQARHRAAATRPSPRPRCAPTARPT